MDHEKNVLSISLQPREQLSKFSFQKIVFLLSKIEAYLDSVTDESIYVTLPKKGFAAWTAYITSVFSTFVNDASHRKMNFAECVGVQTKSYVSGDPTSIK